MSEERSGGRLSAEDRLQRAYDRYVACSSSGARAGSVEAARAAQARLDLTLCLVAAGEELDDLVANQLARDASALLSATQALPEGPT